MSYNAGYHTRDASFSSSGDEYFDYSQWEFDQNHLVSSSPGFPVDAMSSGHSSSGPSSPPSPRTPSLRSSSGSSSGSSSPRYSYGSDYDYARSASDVAGSPESWDLSSGASPGFLSPASGSSPASSAPSSAGGTKKPRARRVEDRVKTAKVRDDKACLRCHMRKVPCEVGTCTQCAKFAPTMAQEACIHEGRLHAIGLVFPYFADVPSTRENRQAQQHAVVAQIGLETGSTLNINAIQYYHPDGTVTLGLNPSASPSWDQLALWAGDSLVREAPGTFKASLYRFLMEYVMSGPQAPKHEFATKVFQMLCMFRIWSTPRFLHGDGLGHPELDSQIRRIARKALPILERDVIAVLDESLGWVKAKSFKATDEKPILFVCMWLLILAYRQINQAMMSGAAAAAKDYEQMRYVAYRLYLALIVFYTGHFYQPASLSPSLAECRLNVGRSHMDALTHLFADVMEQRLAFVSSPELEVSDDAFDKYLFHMLVDHEQAKLCVSRKRRSRKKHAMPVVPLHVPTAYDMDVDPTALHQYADMGVDGTQLYYVQ
ncbi:uncharacterized protein BROUX77_006738 [Berkeleyomyces rouxiae]|uniref:uncharacterized protein n=1 Tax=Berkeleyomyces rouxiae TaxID=2035830 RepID=UPI003B807DFD